MKKRYKVTVYFEGDMNIYVKANSINEAKIEAYKAVRRCHLTKAMKKSKTEVYDY